MLASLCVERGLYLIGDEAYREFIYDDDTEHTSVLNLAGIEDRAILVDSVSKRYSACGARVGCIISRNPETSVDPDLPGKILLLDRRC